METACGAGCTLRLAGIVSVNNAFSVLVDPVTLLLGNRRAVFTLDRRGGATSADGSFRVTNVNEFGVVYGGLMKFEATLTGDGWLPETGTLSPSALATRPRDAAIAVRLQIGDAQHVTTARATRGTTP